MESQAAKGKSLGFVPTMGALHKGHLSLIERSAAENDITLCSIFVNPLQFNNKIDLERYPRDPEGDAGMLATTSCDVLFCPEYSDLFPQEPPALPDLGSLASIMEGQFRPGHFNGVAVIVRRLFEIVKPGKAYFGLKDYQQFLIVKRLVSLTGSSVRVIGCNTVREANGLALSSRNRLLTVKGRESAQLIYQSLLKAKKMLPEAGPQETTRQITADFKNTPGCELEYFAIADTHSLESMRTVSPGRSVIACIAAYFEGIRLIDNLILIP